MTRHNRPLHSGPMKRLQPVTLDTARLRLRPLSDADAPALFAIFGDAQVMRFWSSPPWPSADAAQALLAGDAQALADDEALRLGLERRDDGQLIGTCSLFNFSWSNRRAELGYALAAPAWGRAYMDEALRAVLRHAFATLGLHRLEADIDPRNEASARSLQRLGFRHEGLLRERWIVGDEVSDSALYGLLKRDWHWRQ